MRKIVFCDGPLHRRGGCQKHTKYSARSWWALAKPEAGFYATIPCAFFVCFKLFQGFQIGGEGSQSLCTFLK